jgi:hypothetical protein
MHTNLIYAMLQCCFQAPNVNFVIQSSTGETISVGENDKSPEFVVMPKGVSHLLAILEVPYANWVVPWCTDKMVFLGSETEGSDATGMTLQNEELFPVNWPPFSDGAIRWPGENTLAILGPTQWQYLAIMSLNLDK